MKKITVREYIEKCKEKNEEVCFMRGEGVQRCLYRYDEIYRAMEYDGLIPHDFNIKDATSDILEGIFHGFMEQQCTPVKKEISHVMKGSLSEGTFSHYIEDGEFIPSN